MTEEEAALDGCFLQIECCDQAADLMFEGHRPMPGDAVEMVCVKADESGKKLDYQFRLRVRLPAAFAYAVTTSKPER